MKVVFAGGGTGGHVLPLVAVARGIKKLDPQAKIYFVGPEEFPLDSLREEGVIIKKIIAAGKIRRYFSLLYLWELIKLPFVFLQSLIVVALINPDVVLGKGSYGSVLPVLAAKLLGKKIILHESDAVPGLANRFLSKLTDNIALSFKEASAYFTGKNIYTTGNPVRLKYIGIGKEESQKILGMATDRPVIFFSGGSQGAQKINNVAAESLNELLKEFAVIWSTGKNNFKDMVFKVGERQNLKLFSLLPEKELAAAYTLCDVVVGRAGAGTIFEAAAFGKPAILIPLERKGGDQPLNAKYYAENGSAKILHESELTSDMLINAVRSILSDRQVANQMSQSAKKFAKIEAAEDLAKILLNLATSNKRQGN